MHDVMEGGCRCGRVRYRATGIKARMFRCHCRDCQHFTGTGHADLVPVDAATFEISAACRTYEMAGGSGAPTWNGFCPNCGSQVYRRAARTPDRLYLYAASLDDPTIYAPARSICTDAAQPWDHTVIGDER